MEKKIEKCVHCNNLVKSENWVYCSVDCIESYVKEQLVLIRQARKELAKEGKEKSSGRLVVIERATGRLKTGKFFIF